MAVGHGRGSRSPPCACAPPAPRRPAPSEWSQVSPSYAERAPDGSILVTERANQVRRLAPSGETSVVAGSGVYEAGFAGDGGPATDARLDSPEGLAPLPQTAGS